ncbi:efflux RND transporter periplasmic adaptor subunit [Marinospirillum minutulum]|uniref:efflux RND transporter periplasmic adaptor subunit n=1 Tax=Marinospirillum minutulum TaxID=64974 RepID=UPI0004145084|nr:efflux RND transporter periplasmic adaptor subunit [Marinospirillum minutulum]
MKASSGFKSIILVCFVLTILITGLWYWQQSRQAQGGWAGGGPIDVIATRLKSEAAPVNLKALGELRAVQQVSLSAEMEGRVTAILFESGQKVKAGSLLVQLDDTLEQAELAAAQARATFTRHQYARTKELASTGATSQERLQLHLFERDQAAAQVKQLQARIRHKRIYAPFDGKLGLRLIDQGQYLNPSETIVSLTNLNQLYANFDLPQEELARVKLGQSVLVDADLSEVGPIKATLTALEPQVNRDTRSATIQAKLANPQGILQPGMYATMTILLPPEPDALILPASAVTTSASGDTVLVVRNLNAEQVGQAEIVPVVVGRRVGDQVVIAQGLQAGDLVVTEGQLRVRPGADLRVVKK